MPPTSRTPPTPSNEGLTIALSLWHCSKVSKSQSKDGAFEGRVLVHLNSLELGGTQINALDLAVTLRMPRHSFMLSALEEAVEWLFNFHERVEQAR